MGHLKALTMIWRGPSDHRAPRQARTADEPMPAVLCRHCGGARLKLSYRRRDKAATSHDEDVGSRTTFILRCADCEGFTTVHA